MPIDYKRYPKNWLSEIRPRIMLRANNLCEECGLRHNSLVYSVKHKGRSKWFTEYDLALQEPKTIEMKNGALVKNPKEVKVILTIAHLDHDETNQDVSDERLKALCQLCHLRYDASEKYRRVNGFKKDTK